MAELTRGQTLPLPPLHQIHLTFIAEVLARAWNGLVADRGASFPTGEEPELNAFMEARLNALLRDDDLWSQMVRSVARGKETITFDGSHLEKRPDLSKKISTFQNGQ